jgi:hypothetical protein
MQALNAACSQNKERDVLNIAEAADVELVEHSDCVDFRLCVDR